MHISMRLAGSLLVAVGITTLAASAQTAPAGGQVRMRAPNPAFALRLAYRAIGAAEARGAGGRYLDAARTHYRNALGRAGSAAAAAAHEAGAAAALARAALDERPLPAPRDIPAPPPLPSPGPAMGPRPGMTRAAPPGPAMGPGPGRNVTFMARGGGRGFGKHHFGGRFNPEALARDAKRAATPEASDLAKAAVDADIAGERAVFGGNREDGMRQHKLARDLASAVRQLADAEHPLPHPPQHGMRRPMSFGPGPTPGGGPVMLFRSRTGSASDGN